MADLLERLPETTGRRTVNRGDRCLDESVSRQRRGQFCIVLNSSRSDGTTDVRFENDGVAMTVATTTLTVVPHRPKPDFD